MNIIIPPSVEKINKFSFFNCVSLTNIKLPNSLKNINEFAFYRCISLKEIELPPSLTSIGNYAFCECSSLEKISLYQLILLNLNDTTFYKCSSLKEIVVSPLIKKFGHFNFEVNTSITKITDSSIGEKNEFDLNQPKYSIKKYIDVNEYFQTEKHITKGGLATVYLVKNKKTSKEYAAKAFLLKTDKLNEIVSGEIQVRLIINHPTIVKFYGFSLKNWNSHFQPILFMEYITNGDLDNIIDIELNNTLRQIILIGVSCGIKYLHEMNIIHGNIAAPNILLDQKGHPHINGFSSSFFEGGKNGIVLGTRLYMAPECLRYKMCKKSDIYSFGVLMYKIITGEYPYNINMKAKRIKKSEINQINLNPVCSLPMKDSLKKLIEKCWKEPNERPSSDEVFNELAYNEEYYLDDVDVNQIKNYINEII